MKTKDLWYCKSFGIFCDNRRNRERIAELESELAAMTERAVKAETELSLTKFCNTDADEHINLLEDQIVLLDEKLKKAEAEVAWHRKEATWNPEFGIYEEPRRKRKEKQNND